MDELTVLSCVNRWVGVLVALVGTIVVAPSGWKLLLRSAMNFAGETWRSSRVWLSRLIPWLRPEPRPVSLSAHFGGSVSLGEAVLDSLARGWNATAPVEERIEVLRQRVTQAEGRLDELTRSVSQEHSERKAAIAELERQVQAEVRKLNEAIERQERDAALIDARGLPSVAVGIVLSGVPDDLARIPWHIGWVLPAIGVGAASLAALSALRSRAAAGSPQA